MSINQARISPSAEAMAQQVVTDIRDRGLVSGDRYLTAEEARSNFRVGKSLINDALKLLADRQVLIRKRRAGTFIGPRFSVEAEGGGEVTAKRAALDVVHVLIPMDYYRANVIPGNTFVEELTRAIPGVSVQLHHIADAGTTDYALKLLDQLKAEPDRREGVVLIRSSRETQIAAQDSGVPAIAFGSTYPDVKRLYSIDPDQEQAGRLAAKVALQQGHQHFALIMRNHWRRGDNLLMEGFAKVLGEAGVGVDRVSIVSSPEEAEVIEHDVAVLLAQAPHPSALVCRSRFHAEAAIRGIRDRGLEPGVDILVIAIQSGPMADPASSVSIIPGLEGYEQVNKVGHVLRAIAEGRPPSELRERIPMKAIDSPSQGLQDPRRAD
ncbi:substrate-binding domain-containing protein [Phycisphaeraceae bacterium D3-23]